MSMLTDVKSATVAASGVVYGARTRVRGILVSPGASAGSVQLLDGGASGESKFSVTTLAGGTPYYILVPANGVLFYQDVYANVANASMTVFYG